ncbi:MAG: hypothetical protein HF314_06285 [Ignavibacteria bacterium]|jgi:hypothetical protein|nr:hypothetical protein [Ignavibacteria bacterium]MCU7502662.1 hypothetical protein [Ignavibacteria bacterium]MCU7515135.1 hypothetical protein [Ignavibacteria bacterium]
MKNLNSGFIRVLVIWYAVFQIAHLTFLLRAAQLLIQFKIFVFPASPPMNGWHWQAGNFLIGMGIMDALNCLLTLAFIWGYFAHSRWRLFVGLLNLSVLMYSAIVFAIATIADGAWMPNMLEYSAMALAFIPVVILFIGILVLALKGRFYESYGDGLDFD